MISGCGMSPVFGSPVPRAHYEDLANRIKRGELTSERADSQKYLVWWGQRQVRLFGNVTADQLIDEESRINSCDAGFVSYHYLELLRQGKQEEANIAFFMCQPRNRRYLFSDETLAAFVKALAGPNRAQDPRWQFRPDPK